MTRYLTLTYVLLLGSTACGSHSSSPSTSPSEVVVTAACSTDSRVTAYSNDMLVKGTTYTVEIMSADPSAPATGPNQWTFKVLDANGTAVDNATVTVVPWMPDHGHGPSVEPQVTNGSGLYTVTKIELFMPGVWQLTFKIAVGSTQDSAMVDFCVAG